MKKEYLIVGLSLIASYLVYIFLGIECPVKKIFGLDCAGCGATRMLYSLIKLDFYQAFRYNPFIFVTLILIILYVIYLLVCKAFRINSVKFGIKTVLLYFVLLIVFMILRNIEGFEFLKPTFLG